MAILKSRFGDPQVVIQSNIDILLALHPVSSSSNITDLRKIYDKVETVSRNFVPTICSPLSGQFIEFVKNEYTHLNNIQLSDCNVNNADSQTDVLSGADHY